MTLFRRKFFFKKTYVASGRSFIEECEFETRALFEEAIATWNKIGDGLWKYEETR